ncbi:hydrogen peroxide-inducible genes activator [Phocaeicola sp.]
MNLQQLEYILAVDELRHFAKAAEYCNVTQPTLSAMIQKLEDELDAKIFDRGVQPVQPTLIGKKIIEQARIAVHQASLIKDLVKEEEQSLNGIFRIAVLPTIAPYLLPRFFPQVMELYPALDIRMIEMKTKNCLAALQAGGVEAAIIAGPAEGKDFLSTPLYYESFFGYVSSKESLFKKEVIRSSEISGEKLWLLDEGHCFRDQLMRFCQLKPAQSCQIAYKLGSMETFMRMVESGKGMTFIPGLAVLQLSEEQKKLVRPFAIPRPTRQICIITRTDFVRHAVLAMLTDKIKAALPKEMLTLQNGQKVV